MFTNSSYEDSILRQYCDSTKVDLIVWVWDQDNKGKNAWSRQMKAISSARHILRSGRLRRSPAFYLQYIVKLRGMSKLQFFLTAEVGDGRLKAEGTNEVNE